MRKTHCKYKDNERETEDEKVDNNFAYGGNDAASGGLRRRERRKYQWRKYQQRKHRQAYPCGGSYAGSGAHLHEDRADMTEGKRCSECGEVLVAQETVPALAARPKAVPAKDADSHSAIGASTILWMTSISQQMNGILRKTNIS